MKKVHANIGTIGHIDHGDTTLEEMIFVAYSGKALPKTGQVD